MTDFAHTAGAVRSRDLKARQLAALALIAGDIAADQLAEEAVRVRLRKALGALRGAPVDVSEETWRVAWRVMVAAVTDGA